MKKRNPKQPITHDHVLIKAMAEENNARYREEQKEKYKRIRRCERSRFWRWFYRNFSKKKSFDSLTPARQMQGKILSEVAKSPVELERALKRWKVKTRFLRTK